MDAVILSIGDELALGQTVDTNAAWLSARLAERGIGTRWHLTVADEHEAITKAFSRASEEAGLVIVTGGLGPTEDDLTRDALAAALGVGLAEDEASLKHIERFFAERGRSMPERNRVQAMLPKGTEALANPAGTAPGIRATLGGAAVFVLPGVPSEMRRMWEEHLVPFLDGRRAGEAEAPGSVILTGKINTFGAGESDVADLLSDLTARSSNPLIGTTVSHGIVSVRLRSEFPTEPEARAALERSMKAVESRLGTLVFSRGERTLAEVVGELLSERRQTLATAESCTAGLLGAQITDPPGSSAYYLGGWVVYTNEAKRRELGVAAEALEQHGAVSEPVARALAEGARQRAGADYALAITGIAGPSGGSDEKPVGTVWLALADAGGQTVAKRSLFPGDRALIRDRSAKAALNMLRLRLIGEA